MKFINNREKKFCVCFAETGDPKQAAALSGYKKDPKAAGIMLLSRDDILSEVERLIKMKEKLARCMSSVGYQRLAFGDTTDAVSLLYAQNHDNAELSSLDLFMISEIKKPKDGSVEIKFFDRLKALEKLESISGENGVKNLFDAIGGAGRGEDGD